MIRASIETIGGNFYTFFVLGNIEAFKKRNYKDIPTLDEKGNVGPIMSFNQDNICMISIRVVDDFPLVVEEEEPYKAIKFEE